MIRAMSLFSGGGIGCWGWGECVRWVAGVEMDPKVAAHYAAVYPTSEMVCAPAQDVDYTRWAGEVDYLHASPPCTRASVANANGGESELDMVLALAVVRAVREVGPRWVTVENVQQYEKFAAFTALVDGLKALGYHVDHRTYNAADYGVPQTRRRLYLRASLSPLPPPPAPTHHGPREEQDGQLDLFAAPTRPWVGWYEAVAHLLPGCRETKLAPWQVKRLTAAGRIDADGNIVCEGGLLTSNGSGFGGQVRLADAPDPAITVKANSGAKETMQAVLVPNVCLPDGATEALFPTAQNPSPSITTNAHGRTKAVLVGDQKVGDTGRIVASDPTAPTAPAFTLRAIGGTGGATPKAVLVDSTAQSGPVAIEQQSPCPTILATSQGNGHRPPKAVLVAPHGDHGDLTRDGADPVGTITADRATKVRAVLVEGVSAGDRPPTRSVGGEPSVTLGAAGTGGRIPSAVLVSPFRDPRENPWTNPEDPSYTFTSDRASLVRVQNGTRTVRLSPECLVALMGAEGYPVDGISASLAGHIAGNGDCPPLRRAVFCSMLEAGR